MNRTIKSYVVALFAFTLVADLAAQDGGQKKDLTESQKRVMKLLTEAHDLQGRKRYVDALAKVTEAEALSPDNPEIFNVRGSIYLAAQLRDFDKARADFNKAKELAPDAVPPLFNLAELEFVAGNFSEAEKGFDGLTSKFDRMPVSMRHLLKFKIFICKVKQGQRAEAEAYLKDNFTFLDDTPAYYFAKAVLAMEDKKDRLSNEWLAKAQIIFKKPDNAAFLDSLLEAHYIHSVDIPEAEGQAAASEASK